MLRKVVCLYALLILSVIGLVGCGTSEGEPSSIETGDVLSSSDSQFVEYGVAGHIVEINTSETDGIIGTIKVEGSEDNGALYTEAIVTITNDTKIYLSNLIDFNHLEEGMYVNVFFEGAVAESYPVQATAKQLNIIPDDVN